MSMSDRTIDAIKREVDVLKGKPVFLKTLGGRQKKQVINGVLTKTYPQIFIITVCEDGAERNLSYSYSEILTNHIKLIQM